MHEIFIKVETLNKHAGGKVSFKEFLREKVFVPTWSFVKPSTGPDSAVKQLTVYDSKSIKSSREFWEL